jgi:hypothetical protein
MAQPEYLAQVNQEQLLQIQGVPVRMAADEGGRYGEARGLMQEMY